MVCVLGVLFQALDRHGQVTLRRADLNGLMGLTQFPERTINFAPDLSYPEWRSTFAHELIHLCRGPVPHRLADTEEVSVQLEAAALLVPAGKELAEDERTWGEDDIQRLAARYAVDRALIVDAVNPPTLPFPRYPAQRNPADCEGTHGP